MAIEFSLKTGDPATRRSACLVAGVFATRKLPEITRELDQATGGAISAVLRRGDMDGEADQALLLHDLPHLKADRLLLVGCGKAGKFDDRAYRRALAAAAGRLRATGAREALFLLTGTEVVGRDPAERIRLAAEAISDALYRFDELKSEREKSSRGLRRAGLYLPDGGDRGAAEIAVREGSAIAEGVCLARHLANLPGNICTPRYLARQARRLQKDYSTIKAAVLDEAAMKKLGMGALLSVARGSRQPPRLIVLHYRGTRSGAAPIVLVGKGLTFDAGGISLKPAAAMDEMKFDMCGGASVFGALKAAAALRLPVNVVGVVPSSENLPDGNANKPGDVVTSMSGRTIEILNTDAEGRLILCDALTYAGRFKPAVVVDIATLTGACVVALGAHASGLFANDQALADELLEAGRRSSDRAWQLPLWDDYQRQLDSNFADLANVGGREAGAVTAACFLARFAEKYRWAHLDIAGTAWKGGKEKGATGRPVSLLTRFLIDRADGRR